MNFEIGGMGSGMPIILRKYTRKSYEFMTYFIRLTFSAIDDDVTTNVVKNVVKNVVRNVPKMSPMSPKMILKVALTVLQLVSMIPIMSIKMIPKPAVK